jgi:predicted DNA-binding antitoxin AbrB/MazE fold protein
MTDTVTAVYEKGVLRPAAPLPLADGETVRLLILPAESPHPSAAERLAAIAALPVEPGPEFTGRDHDRVLYGDPDPS